MGRDTCESSALKIFCFPVLAVYNLYFSNKVLARNKVMFQFPRKILDIRVETQQKLQQPLASNLHNSSCDTNKKKKLKKNERKEKYMINGSKMHDQ